MSQGRSYRFGCFQLEADGRVLLRDGKRVALSPKAIDVLVALIEARDHAVGKEDLLRQVWGDTVVEEGSLTSHISLLLHVPLLPAPCSLLSSHSAQRHHGHPNSRYRRHL